MLVHITVHTVAGASVFADGAFASWMWRRLRSGFPNAVAGCLLPDHLHVLAPAEHALLATLGGLMSGAARKAGIPRLWLPAPPPQPIPDAKHLERQVRYVHLNPCRAGLVSDPLEWPWSTHRGVVGAELEPWVSSARLKSALGSHSAAFAERFHAYVSGDPSVDPRGTRLPDPAPASEFPRVSLAAICRAALAATPWSTAPERRKITARLAWHQGWRSTALVAAGIDASQRTVRRILEDARDRPSDELRAALLCLNDPRLTRLVITPKREIRQMAAPRNGAVWLGRG